jgi:hypothetical protein
MRYHILWVAKCEITKYLNGDEFQMKFRLIYGSKIKKTTERTRKTGITMW